MKLQQLRQFVAVAETLSFHRASERLNIAQPPLSMAIKRLENELGMKLFERTSQSVALTEAGRAALEPARNAIFHADQVRQVLAQVESGHIGRLRIAFVPSAMLSFLPRTITRLRVENPTIQLDLVENDTQAILSLLSEGQADVGIVRHPAPQYSSITLVPIQHDGYIAALPEGHRLSKSPGIALEDLASDSFVLPSESRNPTMFFSVKATCAQAGFIPKIVQHGEQAHTILAFVESGIGVALVPEMWKRIAPPGVVLRPLTQQTPASRTGLSIAHRADAMTFAKRRMIEVAIDVQKAFDASA
ncbi:LysR substrate-binding domain-containing protein [Sphingopyxis sp. JAI108]|uniref:LysR substrate-binding domain-containing protein n=1 Tax=Sphingopyxis sp. JAI108 TaxID=2723060 RepID=UPI0015CC4F57|nr:LysR substrate-binding domain-containing protein [Sphingopyxis sp. JAI108]NYF30576.1 DNA-binding transcriptional LysR family regulator [Sphingopyxis sp. JAI108]